MIETKLESALSMVMCAYSERKENDLVPKIINKFRLTEICTFNKHAASVELKFLAHILAPRVFSCFFFLLILFSKLHNPAWMGLP